MKKPSLTRRTLVIFLTLLILVTGCVSLLQCSAKVVKTGTTLTLIWFSHNQYNEAATKTSQLTQYYNQDEAERKALYNSEDWVVRTYSNCNIVVKIVVLLLAMASFLFFPYLVFLFVLESICEYIRKNRIYKRRQMQQ